MQVETCGEVKLCAKYLEQLPPKVGKAGVLIANDMSWYTLIFHHFLEEQFIILLWVQSGVEGMKVAYFKNLATMTMMVPYLLYLGKK